MATFQDGNVRRATDNSRTAASRSAQTRQCPRCKRKSALARVDRDTMRGSYCRYPECGYKRLRNPEAETFEEARARWTRANPEDADHSPTPTEET